MMNEARVQLEEVTDLMRKNISKIEEREERIHILKEKTEDLEEKGKQFKVCCLAAMSSSRSEVVTQFVRSFVRSFVFPSLFFLLVSLKFLLVLKSFNGVSRLFKVCLKFKEV